VAYPFGHGLSYTRFEYGNVRVGKDGDDGLTVACVVANAGDEAGHEVVQLYVGDLESRVARPPRELKGFTRIFLAPGASQEVTFTLSARDLSYWSAARRSWRLDRGEFRVELGASSRDIRLTGRVAV
jgi:beta-glucosidase